MHNFEATYRIDRLASVADTIEAGDFFRVALPFAQAGDVKLAIAFVEMGAHANGGEFKRESHDPALHCAVDLVTQNKEEAGPAIRLVEHFTLERSPFIAGDPNLPAARVVVITVGEPAERRRPGAHQFLAGDGIGDAEELAGFGYPVNGRRGDPGALIVA